MGHQSQEWIRKHLESEAEVFVLPCKQSSDGDVDGIPVVLMEAMSAGLPVVTTAISGIPELVEDGINGVIVPQAEPHAIAQAILRLADDRASAALMGRRGRTTVEQQYTSSTEARKLLSLFVAASGQRMAG
jgi:glycosyltransferase involved in cell wall biosynthesis